MRTEETGVAMITNPALLPKVRSNAIMDAMRYYPCELRVSSLFPGHRCSGQETVVGCHLSDPGKSMASKTSDLYAVAGCFHCHDIVDGRDRMRADYIREKYPTAFAERLRLGLQATQARLVGDGIIEIKGATII